MPDSIFEIPRISPLIDGDTRKKLLGDMPTLDDIIPTVSFPSLDFGASLFSPTGPSIVVESSQEEEKGEEE